MFPAERWQALGGSALETNQTMLGGTHHRFVAMSCPSQHSGTPSAMCSHTGRVNQWQMCWWAREQEFSVTGRKNSFHHCRAGPTRCNLLGSKEH